MAVIKYTFINKKNTKIILNKLHKEQYIDVNIINNVKIYTIKNEQKIENKIQIMKHNIFIKSILNIDECTFMVTSLFYEVRNNHGSQIKIIDLNAFCLISIANKNGCQN